MTDMVNRPSHYVDGRQYEPINVIADWELNYRLGSALKYISRAGRKDPSKTAEDLKKAVFYLNREIESLETTESPYAVTYEDVLEDYATCASEGYDVRRALDDQCALWDDSLGPLEPPRIDYLGGAEWDAPDPEEAALHYPSCEVDLNELHKDLDQFEIDEIISTFERRGILFGVDKHGRTYTLGIAGLSQ